MVVLLFLNIKLMYKLLGFIGSIWLNGNCFRVIYIINIVSELWVWFCVYKFYGNFCYFGYCNNYKGWWMMGVVGG